MIQHGVQNKILLFWQILQEGYQKSEKPLMNLYLLMKKPPSTKKAVFMILGGKSKVAICRYKNLRKWNILSRQIRTVDIIILQVYCFYTNNSNLRTRCDHYFFLSEQIDPPKRFIVRSFVG